MNFGLSVSIIGEDCVLIRNDTYSQGILPLLIRYDSQLVENDVTMNVADIIARAMLTMSATDTQTKESIEKWLSDLRKGKLSAIGELPAMVGNQDRSLNITPFQQVAAIFTDLIEYHQYLKAGKYNELGLNANYNMKRESINSNESQLNDDMLHPLIDDMLRMRQQAVEEVNKMFGTNITVEFNSAWETNEVEEELTLEQMESVTEDMTTGEEVAPEEVTTEQVTADDVTVEEETEEETPAEEVTEETTEETPIEEVIAQSIETAAEVIADAITEDKTEETEEQGDNE